MSAGLVRARTEGREHIFRDSMFSKRACMRILHERGALIGARDKHKMRALDYAVMYNFVTTTEWLLEAMGLDTDEYVPGSRNSSNLHSVK